MTLPLSLMRDAPSVQRANSNRSSLSEPLTPGTSVASQSQGFGVGQKLSPGPGGAGAAADSLLAAASISSSAAGQAPMARKLLFEMFAGWSEEGDGAFCVGEACWAALFSADPACGCGTCVCN